MSKAIPFLAAADACLARRASHLFLPVQHYLSRKGRMPADPDHDVLPVRIQDMKAVVVDVRQGLLRFDGMVLSHIPYPRLRPALKNEK